MNKTRNCKGQSGFSNIQLSPEIVIDKCPMRVLMDRQCSEVYSLIRNTLLADFVSYSPSQYLEELNIYFIYRNTIISGESFFSKYIKDIE